MLQGRRGGRSVPQPSPGSMAGVRRCAPCASVCAVCAVCVVCAVCAVGCVFCARVWGSGNVVRSQVIRGSGSVVSVTLSLPGGGVHVQVMASWQASSRPVSTARIYVRRTFPQLSYQLQSGGRLCPCRWQYNLPSGIDVQAVCDITNPILASMR